jgi:hypothetical protein
MATCAVDAPAPAQSPPLSTKFRRARPLSRVGERAVPGAGRLHRAAPRGVRPHREPAGFVSARSGRPAPPARSRETAPRPAPFQPLAARRSPPVARRPSPAQHPTARTTSIHACSARVVTYGAGWTAGHHAARRGSRGVLWCGSARRSPRCRARGWRGGLRRGSDCRSPRGQAGLAWCSVVRVGPEVTALAGAWLTVVTCGAGWAGGHRAGGRVVGRGDLWRGSDCRSPRWRACGWPW